MPTIPYKNKEGKRIPGVTTINSNLGWNKEALLFWANKIGREQGISHRDVSMAEASAGSLCHAMIEEETLCQLGIKRKISIVEEAQKGLDKEQIEKANKGFENYQKWSERLDLMPMEAEPHLVSEELRVGATPDLVAHSRDGIVLVDYKTATNLVVYPTDIIQVSAYQHIWDSIFSDQKIGNILIIKLDKIDASFAHFEFDVKHRKIKAGFEVFKHLRAIHDLKSIVK